MTKNAQAAVSLVVIGIVAFCPFPTSIAQPLRVQLTRNDGQSAEGIHVYEKWESFGLFGSGHKDVVTDVSGYAVFPVQNAYGSIATRIFGRAVTLIAVHSSYGASVTIEFTLPPTLQMDFRSPSFSPLEILEKSGSYRDRDGRIYFYQTSQIGQRVIVSGEFANGTGILQFQLEKKESNQPLQLTRS